MNQGIIFADLVSFVAERDSIVFIAQQQGIHIRCWVSRHYLQANASSEVNAAEVDAAFESQRFDLEALAETKILLEQFEANGDIVLG